MLNDSSVIFLFFPLASRKEIEPFLPPLKPEFCVKQAMRAILTDQPMICTPRIVYMVNFMKRYADTLLSSSPYRGISRH